MLQFVIRYKIVIFIFTSLLINCRFDVQGQKAPDHLQYFGFALVDVLWDDPHDAAVTTNYIEEVDSFSNIAQLGIYSPTDNIISRTQKMNSLCVKPLLSLQSIFFEYVDTNSISGVNYDLSADYVERWGTFKAINYSILNENYIGAFYLVDEPYWTGVTYAELSAVSELLNTDYPDIPQFFVEAYLALEDLIIPETVDWVGFDKYGVYYPNLDTDYLNDLETLKSKRSIPQQKIVLIIDDQWLPLYGLAGYAPEDIEGMVENYYNLAVADTSVIGLIGYLWAGGLDDPEQLGVRNLPSNVISKNIEIGYAIKQNNPSCQLTALNNLLPDSQFALYPNPSSGAFTIQNNGGIWEIEIYNHLGVPINHWNFNYSCTLFKQSLPAGCYFISINKQRQFYPLIIVN